MLNEFNAELVLYYMYSVNHHCVTVHVPCMSTVLNYICDYSCYCASMHSRLAITKEESDNYLIFLFTSREYMQSSKYCIAFLMGEILTSLSFS